MVDTSIYQLIRSAHQEDELRKRNDLSDEIRELTTSELLLLKNALKAILVGWNEKASEQFDQLNKSVHPMSYVDLLAGLLPTENQANQMKYAFVCMLEGQTASRVMVGLEIFENFVVSDKTLKSVIETLGQWDVLTESVLRIVQKWPEREDVYVRLANQLHGSARDRVICLLEGVTSDSIDFMLNDALEVDSSKEAVEHCLMHAGINGLLSGIVNHDEFTAIGRLYANAVYADVELNDHQVYEWVKEGYRQVLDATDYGLLALVKDHAIGISADTYHLIEQLFIGDACKETMIETMKFGKGFETAKVMGIVYKPYLMAAIKRNPTAYTEWFEEMMQDPIYQPDMRAVIMELNKR